MNKLFALLLGALLATPAYGAATFFWRAESTTLTAGSDLSPDLSATGVSGVSISATAVKVGTNGIISSTTQDYYQFDPAGIISTDQGVIAGWIQAKTAMPSTQQTSPIAYKNSADPDAVISVGYMSGGTGEFRLFIQNENQTSLQLSTTNCNMTIDNWYFVMGRWHIDNDDREIKCYDSSGTLLDSVSDLTTDLAAVEPTTIDELRVAFTSSNANPIWVDNAFVSATYGDPIENFHSITSITPTYTAGPTNGTFTNTTLPFTYTTDQPGTTFAAACTNGQTIGTGPNVESGTCSGGAAAGTGNDVNLAGVGDLVTIGGLTASTTYDVYIVQKSDLGVYSTVQSLADRATTGGSAPGLSSTSVTPTTNGYTYTGICTGTGTLTVEAVGCALADAAPSSNEIEAGQCGGGNAALMNASEVWTTGVSNNFTLTSANKPPKLDVYASCTDNTLDSAVDPHVDELRTAVSGYSINCPASVGVTSIFDVYDTYWNPTFTAPRDCVELGLETIESADCDVSMEADGDIIWTPASGGACDGKRTVNAHWEYGGSATTGLFTNPSGVGNFTTPDLVCNGNGIPISNPEPSDLLVALVEDVLMDPRDFNNFTGDPNSDPLTWSVVSGTPPVGTTISSAGVWSGTPTTENEAGAVITVRATDPCGDFVDFTFTSYVVFTFVAPNCVGNTIEECVDELLAVAPWRANDIGLSVDLFCNTVSINLITAQDPAAASAMTAYQELTADANVLCVTGRKFKLGFFGRLTI